MMPCRIPDIFKIIMFTTSPNTALTGGGPDIIPSVFTHEDRLKLDHAGIGKKQGWIILGHERRTFHHSMAMLGEIV
jgi:hypothetical protein